GGGFLEHFHERTDIIETRKRAVAGNHFHIGGQLRGSFFERINHALNAAAARDIDEGKAVTDKIVAHVDDIVFREKDDGIAVGVAGRKMEQPISSPLRWTVTSCSNVMIGSAAFSAGLTSILREPPLPAAPPVTRRFRTLSCAMTVEPELAKGALPPE